MFKKIIVILLISILLLSLYNFNELKRPSYKYLKSVTVRIYGSSIDCKTIINENGEKTDICEEKSWLGTGVIIKIKRNKTFILTNAHITGEDIDGKKIIYVEDEERKLEAKVIKLHDYLDLAILKVEDKLHYKRPIKGIFFGIPQDRVYLVGHHLGREYLYGEGVFSGYDELNDIVQVPCLFGNSGSGIFNQNGQLIGLVYAINIYGFFSADVAHAVCIDGISIRMFINNTLLE